MQQLAGISLDITSHRDQMCCHHIWVAKSTVITGVLDLWFKHATIFSNGIKTKDDAKFPQGQTSMSSLVFDGTGNLEYLDLMAFYIFLRFSHPVFFLAPTVNRLLIDCPLWKWMLMM